MFITPDIVVTSHDLQRLHQLIRNSQSAAVDRLDEELARARVVPPGEVAHDVVTMNSEVEFEDVISGTQRRIRLVYPEAADAANGRISILSPLGSALLGLRVGQEFDWMMPNGKRRVRVVNVPYQPEAGGDLEL